MNDANSLLPWFTSHWWVLGIFMLFATLFHVILVHLRPLSSIGWKKVDYFWLAMALLGIFAAVTSNRANISRSLLADSEARARSALQWVYRAVADGTSIAVCRSFIRTQYSPPSPEFERLQEEFDTQCEWFKKIEAALGPISSRNLESIDITVVAGPVPIGGEKTVSRWLVDAINGFNLAASEVAALRASSTSNTIEIVVQFLGPILLALALALRVTKVTGEIQIERKKTKREA